MFSSFVGRLVVGTRVDGTHCDRFKGLRPAKGGALEGRGRGRWRSAGGGVTTCCGGRRLTMAVVVGRRGSRTRLAGGVGVWLGTGEPTRDKQQSPAVFNGEQKSGTSNICGNHRSTKPKKQLMIACDSLCATTCSNTARHCATRPAGIGGVSPRRHS